MILVWALGILLGVLVAVGVISGFIWLLFSDKEKEDEKKGIKAY